MTKSSRTSWAVPLHRRKPLARWRKVLSVILLVLMVGGFIVYRRLTEEARLRGFAQTWLEAFTGGEVTVDRVQLDLFEGLHLVGVSVAVPAGDEFDPEDNSPEASVIFKVPSLFLRLRPFSIVSGELVVPEIVAVGPDIKLVYRASDGVWNWQSMLAHRQARTDDLGDRLPVIRLRNLGLQLQRLDHRGRVTGGERKLWVRALPKDGDPETYRIELIKLFTDDVPEHLRRESGEVEVDLKTLAVAGSLPAVAMEDLSLVAPEKVAYWLNLLGLKGYLRADAFSYAPKGKTALTVQLQETALAIPICEEEQSLPADERYLKLTNVAGTIAFDGSEVALNVEGRLRDSMASVRGRLILADERDAGLSRMGFDLQISVANLTLPRDEDAPSAAERRFVRNLPELQRGIKDFDGIGSVDVSIHLSKSAQSDGQVRFDEGRITLAGCSARYIKFPYRLHELTGEIHFRPDGRVGLKDLVGRHGSARVVINGFLGGRVSKEGDLIVTAENIELDEALLKCLSDRQQGLIRQFNPSLSADVRVHMIRPPSPLDEPIPPWDSEVDIAFRDGAINMDRFRYPLDRLSGRIHIADGKLEVSQLCGRHGEAKVCVDGQAHDDPEKGFDLDLALEATDVPLDEVLGKALPDSGRQLYEQLLPTGFANVSGRLFTSGPGAPVACDLDARLREGSFAIPAGAQARINVTEAALNIQPNQIRIDSLEGKLYESPVGIDGQIPLGDSEGGLSLHLTSEKLIVEDRLRALLPSAVQTTWDAFLPAGVCRLDVRYRRGGASSQPAGTGNVAHDYTVVLEPIACSARYDGFPLPLAGVNGRVVITPEAAVIEHIAAESEGAVFDLTGRVELSDRSRKVALSLEAKDVGFTETLRQALPWRLRRLYNDLAPAGKVDLSFKELTITPDASGQAKWSFDGQAQMHDMALDVGTKLTDVNGTLRAQGQMDQRLAVSGDLAWSSVVIDGRLLNNARAKFARLSGETRLTIEDVVGQFYGGKIVGSIELDETPYGGVYGLSLTAHDISLGDFLNAKLKPGQQPVTLKGVVEGNLAVAGRFGDPETRHGGGTVLIHHAQMLKVPFMLAMLQVIHLAVDDDNAFHDAQLRLIVDGDDLILDEIDLRGKSFSMVGAGRVHTPTEKMDVTLLVGSPLKLPRLEVLSEFVEGFARELVVVRVEGTLGTPRYRAEIVRGVKKTLEMILKARSNENVDQ